MDILYPVILPVPTDKQQLKGRDKVRFLSRHARAAAMQSAELSRLPVPDFPKYPDGSPCPSQGIFWSISHKPAVVAGVAAGCRIGIDIEKIRPYTPGLEKKIADADEWALYPGDRTGLLFRFWTAKEAVLKTEGVGLAGLSVCRLRPGGDDHTMTVCYHHRVYTVQHYWFDNHVAALATEKPQRIQWTLRMPPA